MKNLSIIIPFKGSTATLPRLFSSIPEDDNIEIILIENSNTPRSREKIGIDRDYILLNAEENRYAGGARNVGIEAATGKWLIFADADDFFTDDAFTVFNQYIDSAYDLVYFGCDSVFLPSFLPAKRHKRANQLVLDKVKDKISDVKVKVEHIGPIAKMIRRSFILDNNIKFDEIIVAEDVLFSVKCGLLSYRTGYDKSTVYIITDNENSISKMHNKQTINAYVKAIINRNNLLTNYKLEKYRTSILISYLITFIKKPMLLKELLLSCIKYRKHIKSDFLNIQKVIYRKFDRT